MPEYRNVSVRLDENDYKKLEYLMNKYGRMSMGKVSFADVLRIAVKELHASEVKNTSKIVAKAHADETKE
jgi:Arc/MetJ-type ribon-helix-helix transcriptional regulator